jgi:hypothetical protein
VRDVLSLSGVAPKSITAIGLSGQMHGAVVLDEHDEIVRPSIIWCDQRTDEQCEWLTRTIGAARLLELTSNPALNNFTLTKLLWVRQHEPHVFARIRRVLLPKAWLRSRLCGEAIEDMSDASGTLWLSLTNLDPNQPIKAPATTACAPLAAPKMRPPRVCDSSTLKIPRMTDGIASHKPHFQPRSGQKNPSIAPATRKLMKRYERSGLSWGKNIANPPSAIARLLTHCDAGSLIEIQLPSKWGSHVYHNQRHGCNLNCGCTE